MSICAICNAVMEVCCRVLPREATVRASELLLQERAPHYLPSRVTVLEGVPAAKVRMAADDDPARQFCAWHLAAGHSLMSNGNYSLMVTASGMGWSRWKGMAINRWREDQRGIADGCAAFCRPEARAVDHDSPIEPVHARYRELQP